MGKLVKLIGMGIGLASEAYQARKETKATRSQQPSPAVIAGPSNAPRSNPMDDPPPQYAEVSDERAEELIARGQAVPVDEKKQSFDDDGFSDSESSDMEDESDYSLEDDEQDWALDEAADPPAYDEVVQGGVSRTSSNDYSLPPSAPTGFKLPYPVIIPQRRPGSKNRGFVRAYAPDLAACDIDQATFLHFLKAFHKESQASPVFTALYIAGGIAGLVPSVIAMAVSIATQVAAGAAKEVQGRHRANVFLDRMNKELFVPRGLYAMMIKQKPESSSGSSSLPFISVKPGTVDLSKEITNFLTKDDLTTMKHNMRNLRLTAGTTRGEENMPTICAPLIFPGVDAASASLAEKGETLPPVNEDQPGIGSKWKSSQKFVADYMDRRAQASYLAANPDSTIAKQIPADGRPKFRSRFSDPNHPASSGHPLALLSGGLIPAKGFKQRNMEKRAGRDEKRHDKRADRDERRQEKRAGRDENRTYRDEKRTYRDENREDKRANRDERRADRDVRRTTRRREKGGLVGGVKKVLKEDVLYLTIVNLPSPAELEEARRALAQ